MSLFVPNITPGPWEVASVRYQKDEGGVAFISAPTWKNLIDVQLHCAGKEEGLSNAHAVAAIPELLEIVREIVRPSGNLSQKELENKASDALAKAEGRA